MKRSIGLLVCVVLCGCGDGVLSNSVPRDDGSDASLPDASTDASRTDGSTDASIPDASADASTQDAAVDGSTPDASVDAGSDSGPPPAGTVPAFVAQGHVGRTMVSCDDGRSWVGNRSNDNALICFGYNGAPFVDCDHRADTGRGITFGDGWFFATFGWGAQGSVRRSSDGFTWQTVLSGTSFGGLAFGNGRLLGGSPNAKYSDDNGQNWQDTTDTHLSIYNVRRTGFVPVNGGRFLMTGWDPGTPKTTDTSVSNDGIAWRDVSSIPTDCEIGGFAGGFAAGNGVIVMAGDNGACRSTDGGETWQSTLSFSGAESQLVWTGSQFWLWSPGFRHHSTNGLNWTATAIQPSNAAIGAVARSDNGTLVAANKGWNLYYDNQQFYRSTDGINWELLASNKFTKSHPISRMTFGYVQPSAQCPAP